MLSRYFYPLSLRGMLSSGRIFRLALAVIFGGCIGFSLRSLITDEIVTFLQRLFLITNGFSILRCVLDLLIPYLVLYLLSFFMFGDIAVHVYLFLFSLCRAFRILLFARADPTLGVLFPLLYFGCGDLSLLPGVFLCAARCCSMAKSFRSAVRGNISDFRIRSFTFDVCGLLVYPLCGVAVSFVSFLVLSHIVD